MPSQLGAKAYGHSLASNDHHILQQIAGNKTLKRVFISVFGNVNEKRNQVIVSKGKDTKKEIFFYDATSANVWKSSRVRT